MKTASLLAGYLWLCAATPATADTTSQVEKAFAAHVAAVQQRDLAALEQTLTRSNELVLILPDGTITKTRAEYLDFHRRFFAEPGWSISFEQISVIVQPNSAIITTRSTYRDVADGKPFESRSWVTFIFWREAKVWRLVHDQNTRVPVE